MSYPHGDGLGHGGTILLYSTNDSHQHHDAEARSSIIESLTIILCAILKSFGEIIF